VNSTPTGLLDGFAGTLLGALGAGVFLYGVLLLGVSLLGGLWVAAIGAALLCATLVGSSWGRRAVRLAPARGSVAVAGFLTVAALLSVSFVLINAATFAPAA
jgi:hypothetical protein